ncbi:MAG: class I SAM-dependent methyltransferase [Candidatus Diapherotrites archaeon]|nr:class I SAM-dependent methyltransferase [Candidatus Diapherotrites archaeon]
MVTNVTAKQLNYDHYETDAYDRDIVRVIPGHRQMHQHIVGFLRKEVYPEPRQVLELGIGTGLTAQKVLKCFPNTRYIGIDFSNQMLAGAKMRLAPYHPQLILADYAQIELPQPNDLIVSVIGLHHQKTDEDKKQMFQKIHSALSKKGWFIFGDLATYTDEHTAAQNDALHYHYMVTHAANRKTLTEWAHHHKYLNCLSPVEQQTKWLLQAGFTKVRLLYRKFNTVLIVAQK